MGDYRLRVTVATRCAGEVLGLEHDYEDAVYVRASTEHGARAAALATWPLIRDVLSIQEQFYG
jgi:hypothetical protein